MRGTLSESSGQIRCLHPKEKPQSNGKCCALQTRAVVDADQIALTTQRLILGLTNRNFSYVPLVNTRLWIPTSPRNFR